MLNVPEKVIYRNTNRNHGQEKYFQQYEILLCTIIRKTSLKFIGFGTSVDGCSIITRNSHLLAVGVMSRKIIFSVFFVSTFVVVLGKRRSSNLSEHRQLDSKFQTKNLSFSFSSFALLFCSRSLDKSNIKTSK
jgi:hypothetical protein